MKFSKYLPYLGLIALILFLITDTSTFINDIPLNTKKNFKQSEGSHKEGSHKEGSNGQDISQKDKENRPLILPSIIDSLRARSNVGTIQHVQP